jgi:hypothetical protein
MALDRTDISYSSEAVRSVFADFRPLFQFTRSEQRGCK